MTQMPPQVPMTPTGMPLKPHRGGMILAFGIIGLVCCVIFAILAWVMGKNDLKEMAAGRMDPSGQGLTNAGRIMGMIGCILAIVVIIINVIAIIITGGLAFSFNAGNM